MKNEKWITIYAENMRGCVTVEVTGGKVWDIVEDPSVDKTGMSARAYVPYVFRCDKEVRRRLVTKVSDLVVWKH
jgi:hypothetical protein